MFTSVHAALQVIFQWQGQTIGTALFQEHYVVLGRDSTLCDIVMQHPTISREHLLIEHDGRRIVIHDLYSTNGIRIDGVQVKKAEFHSGDSLHISGYTLIFYLRYGEKALQQVLDFHQAYIVPTPEQLAARLPSSPNPKEPIQPLQTTVFEVEEPPVPQPSTFQLGATWLGDVPVGAMNRSSPNAALPQVKRAWLERLLSSPVDRRHNKLLSAWVATLWQHQLLNMHSLAIGQQHRWALGPILERWAWRGRQVAFQVHLTRYGYATAKVPLHTPFVMIRQGVRFTGQQGIREGWVKRRKTYLVAKIGQGEQLVIECQPFLYKIGLAERALLPPKKGLRWLQRSQQIQRALGGLLQQQRLWLLPSFFLQILLWWVWLASQAPKLPQGLQAPKIALSQANLPVLQWESRGSWAPQGQFATYEPQVEPPPAPHETPSKTTPSWRMPGGNQPAKLAGLLLAPPILDPEQPSHAKSLPLRQTAALWRQQQSQQLPAFVTQTIFRHYKLQLGQALQVRFDQANYDPQQTILRQIAEAGPALSQCIAQSPPPDAGLHTRLALIATLGNKGQLLELRERDRSIGDALMQCLRQQLQRYTFPKHRHHHVQAELQLMFAFEE